MPNFIRLTRTNLKISVIPLIVNRLRISSVTNIVANVTFTQ